jgi:hypothetical protein
MSGRSSGKPSTVTATREPRLSSLSFRMTLTGAQYATLGIIVAVAAVAAYNPPVSALVIVFSLAVSAFTQLMIHRRLITDLDQIPMIGGDYNREDRRRQVFRLGRAFGLQLPLVAGLLVAQFLLFNWVSERANSNVQLGAIFLALAAGSFFGYGSSNMGLGYRIHTWEKEGRRRLLEQVWPGDSWRRVGPLTRRIFVEVVG